MNRRISAFGTRSGISVAIDLKFPHTLIQVAVTSWLDGLASFPPCSLEKDLGISSTEPGWRAARCFSLSHSTHLMLNPPDITILYLVTGRCKAKIDVIVLNFFSVLKYYSPELSASVGVACIV